MELNGLSQINYINKLWSKPFNLPGYFYEDAL